MRRPLFWAALCLVLAAAVRLRTGSCDRPREGFVSAGRLTHRETVTVTGQIYQKDGESVCIRAVYLTASQSLDIDALGQKAADSPRKIPLQENLICELSDAELLPLGGRVTLSGTFAAFSRATNPGEFDAAEYYRSIGLGGRIYDAKALALDGGRWPVREGLYRVKSFLKGRLCLALPEKEASVLCALLLGDKSELDAGTKDLYKRNGILHILSISSLHITIIGMSVYRLLRRTGLPVGVSAAAGSLLLLLYGGMTGFGVSACRAIGMYLIRMLAELLGRTYDLLTALGVLAAIMATANPHYLQNSGFLLSFGSVLGIGAVCPALLPRKGSAGRRRGFWSRRREALVGSVSAGIAVTLTTLPVQLWFYYEVPVWSVFLNLLVLPFMKPLMMAGMAAMLPFGGLWGAAAGWILKLYEWLCGCFDRLPFSLWNPGRPRPWQILFYYAVLTAVTVLRSRGKRMGRKALGGAASAAALAAAVLVFAAGPPAENSVTFLDVGQGDCILVRTESGENYLFDCGSSSRKGVGRYVLLPYLKYCGIRRLDAVIVSHPDADHINGVTELFSLSGDNGIFIGQLALPAVGTREREESLGELLRAAGGESAVRYLAAGDVWECGGVKFWCVNPEKDAAAENANACSVCVYAEFPGKISLLLTGDAEGEGEETMLRALEERTPGEVTILKVAHHGSRNATSEKFLDRFPPKIAVISCGENNRYGHPHRELLDRLEDSGAHIAVTSESGAVTLTLRRGEVRMTKYGK